MQLNSFCFIYTSLNSHLNYKSAFCFLPHFKGEKCFKRDSQLGLEWSDKIPGWCAEYNMTLNMWIQTLDKKKREEVKNEWRNQRCYFTKQLISVL